MPRDQADRSRSLIHSSLLDPRFRIPKGMTSLKALFSQYLCPLLRRLTVFSYPFTKLCLSWLPTVLLRHVTHVSSRFPGALTPTPPLETLQCNDPGLSFPALLLYCVFVSTLSAPSKMPLPYFPSDPPLFLSSQSHTAHVQLIFILPALTVLGILKHI